MSVATDNNTAMPATAGTQHPNPGPSQEADAVERALAAAISDAAAIGDLLDTLRSARLWLPLPGEGKPVADSGAVTLPTVTYLGSDFVPAYTSADRLASLASKDRPAEQTGPIPHLVVRASDLARLLPPSVGIALNAGASESVPVYPQGVAFLAAEDQMDEGTRVSVGPLPAELDLLSGIRVCLAEIPQVSQAMAAWLTVQFSGEGLLISVTLDDPADAVAIQTVIAALEQAAAQDADGEAGYPIDVIFPGEAEPDHIDRWVAAFGTSFYRRTTPG